LERGSGRRPGEKPPGKIANITRDRGRNEQRGNDLRGGKIPRESAEEKE